MAGRISATAVLIVAAAAAAAVPNRPNIIYLMADDQRLDSLGCMGNRIIHTPHIDRMAAQGTTFDNAFVTTAICMTSRACVFTGQYAPRSFFIGLMETDEFEAISRRFQ